MMMMITIIIKNSAKFILIIAFWVGVKKLPKLRTRLNVY